MEKQENQVAQLIKLGEDKKIKLTDSSQVYSREEYAKKDFWNDRFKESKGFFDWYANWKEIKPVWEKYLRDDIICASKDLDPIERNKLNSMQQVLMVGCGNSRMSEEMAEMDGYQSVTNMDISAIVLEKMKQHTDLEKYKNCKGF